MNHPARRVGDLSLSGLAELLDNGRFALQTGSLVSRIQAALPDVARSIHVLYAHHPYSVEPDFADFHVQIGRPRNFRRWFRRQAEFVVDGERPFEPLPRDQAPAFLEWGLNWSIAASCQQWLTIHAASLERNGGAVILPAPPGSGKSTLCAALALRGWRLLTDEMSLIDPKTVQAHALARPINLKNASIDLIRGFAPESVWGPETYDTAKGRVTHLRPPADSVQRMLEPAQPRWIVFPRYVAEAEPLLAPRGKAMTFIHFAENAFNYCTLGSAGFDITGRLVSQCDCYDFTYSRLEDALEVFDWLAGGGRVAGDES
ncbi:MAG: HprK-related kinase A [Azonexus sp.]|uniref:HprK-related kinase A n=1 Tax=Azonexus sp. TaxID=1872668 RepID=UPI002838642A|nr:HprK-related kinase A [Azonexus sp.]MDR0776723.1 HprK-related kinase A [Azonexus sp.]